MLIAFRYIISIFLNIFWVFKDVLINMVTIWLKMATLVLLKIKVFPSKDCDIIVFVDDVINRILSRDSDYVVDVVIWPNFGYYHFNERSCHNLNFMRIWPKISLFWGVALFERQLCGTGIRYSLKSLRQFRKRVKLKVRKCGGLIRTFVEITGEILLGKRGRGGGYGGLFSNMWI